MFRLYRPHLSTIIVLTALLIGFMIGLPQMTQAATFNPTTVAELIAAINNANSDPGADIIDLGGQTFTLTAVDNADNGLPIITSDITIINGTITRDAGSPDFRILQVDGGALTLENVTISGGSTGFGGGIFNNGGTLTITNSAISNNGAPFNGGGIYNTGTLTISGSSVSNNGSGFGGGIYNMGTLTVTSSSVSGNNAIWGGGISSTSDTVEVTFSCIENNTSDPSDHDVSLPFVPFGSLLPAENNWWGAFTGPNTPGADTTNVIVGTWLDAPPPPCSTPTVPGVTVIAPKPPTCNLIDINDIAAYDLPDGFYCRVLMRNGAWQTHAGTVPKELIDNGVILAVDVFQLSGRQVDNDFGGHIPVCLEGSGRLVFLDATTSPRVMVELDTFAADGMTCGWVPNAGTLVLIADD